MINTVIHECSMYAYCTFERRDHDYFWRSGSGPPLVLIHGSTADYTRLNPILPGLEQMFTVYAVDRRGSGKSTDAVEYCVEREFEDIIAVVNEIG